MFYSFLLVLCMLCDCLGGFWVAFNYSFKSGGSYEISFLVELFHELFII